MVTLQIPNLVNMVVMKLPCWRSALSECSCFVNISVAMSPPVAKILAIASRVVKLASTVITAYRHALATAKKTANGSQGSAGNVRTGNTASCATTSAHIIVMEESVMRRMARVYVAVYLDSLGICVMRLFRQVRCTYLLLVFSKCFCTGFGHFQPSNTE